MFIPYNSRLSGKLPSAILRIKVIFTEKESFSTLLSFE